jgi:hypothetical protein
LPDPISFTSASPRYQIPFLFAGQSQRELFVNEAHARIDALLHAAVEGTSDSPPATPADGECWLVGEEPTGAWTDHADALASYQPGGWVFAAPRDGMRVFDNLASQMILYRDGWQRPEAPTAPSGGTTVDAEARTAIAGLVEALITAGILPQV